MADLKLQNEKVRFEARFGDYFFARNLVDLDVIDAGVTTRKYKKFLKLVEETFTDETTMQDIREIAEDCKIKVRYETY